MIRLDNLLLEMGKSGLEGFMTGGFIDRIMIVCLPLIIMLRLTVSLSLLFTFTSLTIYTTTISKF